MTDDVDCLYEGEFEYLQIAVDDCPSDADKLASHLETTSEFIGKLRTIHSYLQ